MGKGENAGNQHFLLFPQCFLPFPEQVSIFQSHLSFLSANSFYSDQSKILSFSKELSLENLIYKFVLSLYTDACWSHGSGVPNHTRGQWKLYHLPTQGKCPHKQGLNEGQNVNIPLAHSHQKL